MGKERPFHCPIKQIFLSPIEHFCLAQGLALMSNPVDKEELRTDATPRTRTTMMDVSGDLCGCLHALRPFRDLLGVNSLLCWSGRKTGCEPRPAVRRPLMPSLFHHDYI